MYSAFGIAMIILGIIYPVIVLILISRPRVRKLVPAGRHTRDFVLWYFRVFDREAPPL